MLTANGMPSHHLTYLGSIFFEAVTCSKSRVHGKSSSQSLVAADAKAAKSAVQSRFIIASLKKKSKGKSGLLWRILDDATNEP